LISIEGMSVRPSSWLDGAGPLADMILSTRVRLARNLTSFPFCNRAREDQLAQVMDVVSSAIKQTSSLADGLLLRMGELSSLDRQFLIERRLVSPELNVDSPNRGVVVNAEESLSVMINEEDHLRIQSLCSGFQLQRTWQLVDELDNQLDAKVEYAFSDDWGYLTACPTNVGTAMRVSVLIHLPSLVLTKQIGKVLEGIGKVGLAVRGFYGEGSELMGNFFQISNQTTLGRKEQETLDSLERVTRQIVEYELKARDRLLRDARVQIEDKVWRAYGTLQNARIMETQEAISLLSAVRFGLSIGLDSKVQVKTLNELLVATQPAHLQRIAGQEMDQSQRSVARAELIRNRLLEKQDG